MEWLAKAYMNVPEAEFLKSFNPSDFDIYGEAAIDGLTLLQRDVEILSDQALEAIAVDFTALFASCRPGSPHPYESIFAGGERLLMSDARDSVLAFYAEGGYEVIQDESLEPEDHISHELGYVADLYRNAALASEQGEEDAVQVCLERASSFKAEHLGKWIPVFCSEVEGSAATAFFRGLARLTHVVVESIGDER